MSESEQQKQNNAETKIKNENLMQLVKNEIANCVLKNMTLTVEVKYLSDKINELSIENNRLMVENKILKDAKEKKDK